MSNFKRNLKEMRERRIIAPAVDIPKFTFKLGKKEAVKDKRDLLFARYITGVFPSIPSEIGHSELVKEWGMLGNDQVGNCVIAASYHQLILWNKEQGIDIPVSVETAIREYSMATGYTPNDPSTDEGTSLREFLKYWLNTDLETDDDKYHSILGFVSLDPGNTAHLLTALYMFGTVSIGVALPDTAIQQFQNNKPWDIADGSNIVGGHCVPIVSKREDGMLGCVTWGKEQLMTMAFYEKYCDESYAILSLDMLNESRTSIDGFDLHSLKRDLSLIQ